MKPRTQIIVVAALLIALVAWSAARRGSDSNNAGQGCGTCCPFLPTLDGMRLPFVTNTTTIYGTSNRLSATNLTPSPKQP